MKKISYKQYIPPFVFILLLVFSFLILRPFLLTIFLGALLAYIFYPLYKFLLRKLKRQSVVAFIICLLVLIIFVAPTIFFVKTLIQESYVVYLIVKQRLAMGIFSGCEYSFCEFFKTISGNTEIQFQIQEAAKAVTNWVIYKGSSFLLSLPRILLQLFVLFFTLFYALIDGKIIIQRLYIYLNIEKDKYHHIVLRLKEIIHGLIYGYLLVALIQGAVGALGFFIFGVPSPFFWGLVMALLAFIPFLGTGLVWVPASLFLLFQGIFQDSSSLIFKGIGLFAFGLIIVSNIDNILRPKLVSGKAKIHPAIILLGAVGGMITLGSFGVIIGPLLLSLTTVVIGVYFRKK